MNRLAVNELEEVKMKVKHTCSKMQHAFKNHKTKHTQTKCINHS